MTISDNYIIGIDEDEIPKIVTENILYFFIKGTFKLKYVHLTDIPYYENKLMIFRIIGYKDILLIKK